MIFHGANVFVGTITESKYFEIISHFAHRSLNIWLAPNENDSHLRKFLQAKPGVSVHDVKIHFFPFSINLIYAPSYGGGLIIFYSCMFAISIFHFRFPISNWIQNSLHVSTHLFSIYSISMVCVCVSVFCVLTLSLSLHSYAYV